MAKHQVVQRRYVPSWIRCFLLMFERATARPEYCIKVNRIMVSIGTRIIS